ncbi:hypothetical protein [Streptomyces massasporeus]|uniref:hypothetical protein n=1 Tax=Streptomyces massasporeus TaxID=67324 RepID=UPI0036C9FEA5
MTFSELARFTPETGERIVGTAALSASLAAVSLAVFLVLPNFRPLVAKNGQGYSEYVRSRSLFRGFTIVGCACLQFSAATILGIFGSHWPCKIILLIQEALCVFGLVLSMAAIFSVWSTISASIKSDDAGS